MPNPSRPFRPLPQEPRRPDAIRPKTLLGVPRIVLPLTAGLVACIALALMLASPAARPPALAQAPAPTASPTLPTWSPGGTWRAVHSPKVKPLFQAATTPQGLNAVHGIERPGGGYFALAVGDKCAIARYEGVGTAWTRDRSFEAQCDGTHVVDLRDVFIRAPDDVWVTARYTGGGGLERDCVIKTPADRDDVDFDEGCGLMAHWNGTAWRVQSNLDMKINRLAPPINALNMVYDEATAKWYGWAVGNDAAFDNLKGLILEFIDGPNGGKWQVTSAPNNNAVDLRDIHVLNKDEAWAIGEHGAEAWFYRTDGGAADWSRRGLSGPDHLYALDMVDPLYGWDGGQRGRMNHYDGNCHDTNPETACWFDNKAYPVRSASGQPVTSIEIRGIDLVARGVGWLVGTKVDSSSMIAYLLDDHWTPVAVVDDPDENLNAVFMRTADEGWAVGAKGVILDYRANAPTPSPSPTPRPPSATLPATPTSTASPSPTIGPSATPSATEDRPTASPTVATQIPSGEPTTPVPSVTASGTPDVPASATATETRPASAVPTVDPTSAGGGSIYLPYARRFVTRR